MKSTYCKIFESISHSIGEFIVIYFDFSSRFGRHIGSVFAVRDELQLIIIGVFSKIYLS